MKLKLLAATLFASSALFAGTYTVDTVHSGVSFKVKHMMVSNVKGKFAEFDGTFELDDKTNELKALHGVVEVASIDTGIEDRDAHLKSKDIFNAEKFPQITFKLTKVVKDKAHGEFTMHGVTKNVVFDYEFGGVIKHSKGQKAGLTISGVVNRKDYGISWNKILETGGVAVGEDVKIEIELEGDLK
ncbi:MAG: YceI family protein [Sulfurimonadaceae bacterium]|jgi:polyisoprenoid-binding protein YceI|nr:YceI family protein [Sulfurimonadaceae bacterium]